jgi:molybdate transport system substrate-binding protein
MKRGRLAAAAVFAWAGIAGCAHAADLTIFTGGSMAAPLKEIGRAYTRATGNGLHFVAATTGVLLDKIHAGERPDIIVISAESITALQKEGRIAQGSRSDIARSLLGVAVKKNVRPPDISTPDAFKAAMLSARTISYPDPAKGATSGLYIVSLFQRLGIAEAMKAKTIVKPVGADVAAAVAAGEAELGVTFVSELIPDKRLRVIGPFPAAIQNPTLYAVAIEAQSAQQDAARRFIAALKSPASKKILKDAGEDPL